MEEVAYHHARNLGQRSKQGRESWDFCSFHDLILESIQDEELRPQISEQVIEALEASVTKLAKDEDACMFESICREDLRPCDAPFVAQCAANLAEEWTSKLNRADLEELPSDEELDCLVSRLAPEQAKSFNQAWKLTMKEACTRMVNRLDHDIDNASKDREVFNTWIRSADRCPEGSFSESDPTVKERLRAVLEAYAYTSPDKGAEWFVSHLRFFSLTYKDTEARRLLRTQGQKSDKATWNADALAWLSGKDWSTVDEAKPFLPLYCPAALAGVDLTMELDPQSADHLITNCPTEFDAWARKEFQTYMAEERLDLFLQFATHSTLGIQATQALWFADLALSVQVTVDKAEKALWVERDRCLKGEVSSLQELAATKDFGILTPEKNDALEQCALAIDRRRVTDLDPLENDSCIQRTKRLSKYLRETRGKQAAATWRKLVGNPELSSEDFDSAFSNALGAQSGHHLLNTAKAIHCCRAAENLMVLSKKKLSRGDPLGAFTLWLRSTKAGKAPGQEELRTSLRDALDRYWLTKATQAYKRGTWGLATLYSELRAEILPQAEDNPTTADAPLRLWESSHPHVVLDGERLPVDDAMATFQRDTLLHNMGLLTEDYAKPGIDLVLAPTVLDATVVEKQTPQLNIHTYLVPKTVPNPKKKEACDKYSKLQTKYRIWRTERRIVRMENEKRMEDLEDSGGVGAILGLIAIPAMMISEDVYKRRTEKRLRKRLKRSRKQCLGEPMTIEVQEPKDHPYLAQKWTWSYTLNSVLTVELGEKPLCVCEMKRSRVESDIAYPGNWRVKLPEDPRDRPQDKTIYQQMIQENAQELVGQAKQCVNDHRDVLLQNRLNSDAPRTNQADRDLELRIRQVAWDTESPVTYKDLAKLAEELVSVEEIKAAFSPEQTPVEEQSLGEESDLTDEQEPEEQEEEERSIKEQTSPGK